MQSQPHHSIRITRYFPVPPQEVWHAWTDPNLVKTWFGSDPNGIVLTASIDLHIGGGFEVTFCNSDGMQYTCAGEYKEIASYQRLVFTWTWRDRPEIFELVTVLFQSEGNGTLMIFAHAHIDGGTTHNYEVGWNSTFEKLARTLKSEN